MQHTADVVNDDDSKGATANVVNDDDCDGRQLNPNKATIVDGNANHYRPQLVETSTDDEGNTAAADENFNGYFFRRVISSSQVKTCWAKEKEPRSQSKKSIAQNF